MFLDKNICLGEILVEGNLAVFIKMANEHFFF